jgi:holliday junction DNA helicase RuvB
VIAGLSGHSTTKADHAQGNSLAAGYGSPLDATEASLSRANESETEPATVPDNIVNIADSGPQTLNHVVASGANLKVLESIRIAIDASFASGRPMPHVLLCGGAGTGKTMYGSVIARELGVEPVTVLGQTLRTSADVNGVLVGLTDAQPILLLDEIHTLGLEGQHSLLRAMENGDVFIEPNGRRAKPVAIKLNKLTVIGATTDEHKLLEPLRDRFRLLLRLAPYSIGDIETMLRQRVRQLGWQFDDVLLAMIAARSRGNPRWCLRLAESVWRTATADGASVVRADHAQKTFDLEGIDAQGLAKLDRDYLAVLAESDGPVRLNVIATRLGVPVQSLVKQVEPFLLRLGLVTKDDGGRRLTAQGIRHSRRERETDTEAT